MLSASEEARPTMQIVQSAAEAELILFTPALELQRLVPKARQEELGLQLLAASKDSAGSNILQKLQAYADQLAEKLIPLLTKPGKLTTAALEQLFMQPPQAVGTIPSEPTYRTISPGLSFKSKCKSRGCVAYKDVICVNKGFGQFDIAQESASLACPECEYEAEMPTDCGFYLAQWQFSGITQGGKKPYIPPGRTNAREYFIWKDEDDTVWRSLKVKVEPYSP